MAASKLSQLSLSDQTDQSYVMVAAIDFGTTYSGYAFIFTSKPDDVKMNKNWGEGLGFKSYKTPTSVLTGPDHQFVAFGHKAEQKYTQALQNNEGDHQLYKHFKMILHQKRHVTRKTKVTSTNGHIRPALEIFVMAIKYLKNHLLKAVRKQTTSFPDASLIRWVITVPAIWTDEAKNFMREAAYEAGCITSKDSRQLVIALEPEAASLHCRTIDIGQFTVSKDVDELPFKSKTKYLVVDAGGGTIDITAHEVLLSGALKELQIASGGPWGGTKVDENFVNLFNKALGPDFINAYKQQCPEHWLTMMTSFESLKKPIASNGYSKISLSLPWTMGSIYKKIFNTDIETVLKSCSKLGINFSNGSIIVSHEATMALFEPVVNKVAQHVKELIAEQELKPLSYILLVGGFGESPVLQKSIQNILPRNVKLLVPSEAQLSVIMGAISFGQNNRQITSRISKYTYGFNMARPFVEGKHNEDKRLETDRGPRCDHIFDVKVKKGTSVEIGKVVKATRKPVNAKQKVMTVRLFCTNDDKLNHIEYVDDPKFTELCKIRVDMSNTKKGLDRRVDLQLEFGDTEILVTASDESGETAETLVDFLT